MYKPLLIKAGLLWKPWWLWNTVHRLLHMMWHSWNLLYFTNLVCKNYEMTNHWCQGADSWQLYSSGLESGSSRRLELQPCKSPKGGQYMFMALGIRWSLSDWGSWLCWQEMMAKLMSSSHWTNSCHFYDTRWNLCSAFFGRGQQWKQPVFPPHQSILIWSHRC